MSLIEHEELSPKYHDAMLKGNARRSRIVRSHEPPFISQQPFSFELVLLIANSRRSPRRFLPLQNSVFLTSAPPFSLG
jgi:hypothetical protein